jgi:hypothetical protein
MALLTASASVLLLFFFAGEFIGIKGFSRRPVPRSTMWNINVLFAMLWVAAVTMLLFERTSGVVFTLVLSVLWLIAQLRTHWTPYVLGAPEEYRREYRHIFQNTVSILPRLTRRGIVPNLYHTLLLILLVITVVSGIVVLVG